LLIKYISPPLLIINCYSEKVGGPSRAADAAGMVVVVLQDYAIDVGRNICHGSDSVENAKKEIALWFKEGEVQTYKSAQHDWIYEKP
jgi:hypothetical protein